MRCEARKLLFLLREVYENYACMVTQCLILSQNMKTFIIALIFATPLVSFSAPSHDESRLQVDPNLKKQKITMEDLYKKHVAGRNVPTITSLPNNTYMVDYSVVVEADAEKLQSVAQSYHNYVKWKVPQLDDAIILKGELDYGKTLKYDNFGVMSSYDDGDRFLLWSKLSISVIGLSFSSKQYYDVKLRKDMNSSTGNFGSAWVQITTPRGWTLPDESELENQKGSWYLEPVTWTGSTTKKTYIRYFLYASIVNPFAGVVEGEIRKQFKTGAVDLVKVLVDQSHKR